MQSRRLLLPRKMTDPLASDWFKLAAATAKASLDKAYDQDRYSVPTWYRQKRDEELAAQAEQPEETRIQAAIDKLLDHQ